MYATAHPELRGTGELADRLLAHLWRREGMQQYSAAEYQEYAAQLRYAIERAAEAEPAYSLNTANPPPPLQAMLTAGATGNAASPTWQAPVRDLFVARGKVNQRWRAKQRAQGVGPASQADLFAAPESNAAGVFAPVLDEPTFAFAIGQLAIITVEGGLNPKALDVIEAHTTTDKGREGTLDQLERILSSWGIAGAKDLVGELRWMKGLRNATPPFHTAGGEAWKPYDHYNLALPIDDYGVAWDQICRSVTKALQDLADVLL